MFILNCLHWFIGLLQRLIGTVGGGSLVYCCIGVCVCAAVIDLLLHGSSTVFRLLLHGSLAAVIGLLLHASHDATTTCGSGY